MFTALTANRERVFAEQAAKDKVYFCPVCKNKVVLRSGKLNADHFAHVSKNCNDDWKYDMSEWHLKIQNYFPKESREVVVRGNNAIHRADVLIDKTVIEIQHSPISAEEFNKRNVFFRNHGYRIVWIFDVRDKVDNEQIEALNDEYTKFKWKKPLRIFETLEMRITDYDKSFAIYFDLFGEEDLTGDDILNQGIYKAVWTTGNNEDSVDFSRFAVRENAICMEELKNFNELFLSQKETWKIDLKAKIQNLNAELISREFGYKIKYSGEKEKKPEDYTCERDNRFGLDLWEERGCKYCSYCALMVRKQEQDKTKHVVYCCYPNRYRAKDSKAHPGYECNAVDEYEM